VFALKGDKRKTVRRKPITAQDFRRFLKPRLSHDAIKQHFTFDVVKLPFAINCDHWPIFPECGQMI